jgi:hypothetical protein
VLAVLVNVIELLCTAGLPALYTQILTMQELPTWQNYAYLGLYNLAYMFDDSLMVAVVVMTLGRRKLQESWHLACCCSLGQSGSCDRSSASRLVTRNNTRISVPAMHGGMIFSGTSFVRLLSNLGVSMLPILQKGGGPILKGVRHASPCILPRPDQSERGSVRPGSSPSD